MGARGAAPSLRLDNRPEASDTVAQDLDERGGTWMAGKVEISIEYCNS